MMTVSYLEIILSIAVVILLIGIGALISSILNHRKIGETQRQLEDIKKSADHAVKNAKAAAQATEYFRQKQEAEQANPREVTIVNDSSEPVPVAPVSGDKIE